MNLDESQRRQLMAWIDAGLRVSEIQNKLAAELGLGLTYMELRFLLDDLKLRPRDIEPPKPVVTLGTPARPVPPATPDRGAPAAPGEDAALDADAVLEPEDLGGAGGPGGVSLTVDQVTRAGAVVSGKVSFSDGQSAAWYLDQYGHLGMVSAQQGYRPSQADVMEFQAALQGELAKLGF